MIYAKNTDKQIYIPKTTAIADLQSAMVFVDKNRAETFEISCKSEIDFDFYKIDIDLEDIETGEYEYIFGVESGLIKIISNSDSIFYDKNTEYITYDA